MGPVAQLGERLVRNEEVSGSSPLRSTMVRRVLRFAQDLLTIAWASRKYDRNFMRFYVSPEYIYSEQKRIEIKDKGELRHIRDVMRLAPGSEVVVFDGTGMEYLGRIKGINRSSVAIDIIRKIERKEDMIPDITLYQAIPKKGRMDLIVEKAVELGVTRVTPMITERTIPSIIGKAGKKQKRWSRIAMTAAKQCGRAKLPLVAGVMDFEDCLEESGKSGFVAFAALDKNARPLKELLKGSRAKNISVFVGPEGDFSQKEIELARSKGYAICSLGGSVLRVETAAIYILSCVNYEYSS